MTNQDLKTYLGKRYKSSEAVPDYLYQAYRLLFHQAKDPHREQVLSLAKLDIEEAERTNKVRKFNDIARQLPGIENKPWNWGSRR